MTMKKIIFVYIIFGFLLTSFAGCGKLKDSPVSGLNQTDTPALSKVDSQSEKGEPVKPTPLPEPTATPKPKKQETEAKGVSVKKVLLAHFWKDRTGLEKILICGIVFGSAIIVVSGIYNFIQG
jgi:hypothetical protein